jgi:ABC-type glutathione transport system ATPase component
MTELLKVENLSRGFAEGRHRKQAVRSVSFSIDQGECLALIGESGSGKSTIANMIAGFVKPDAGRIYWKGKELSFQGRKAQTDRQGISMVYQDPGSSLIHGRTILQNLEEALLYRTRMPVEERRKLAEEQLMETGLDASFLTRYPSELSGGECQRAALAEALLAKPDLLILDEATSALDVSVQAQIMRLLLQEKKRGISILMISHDPLLASFLCEKMMVLRDGELVEAGSSETVLLHPAHAYTQALMKLTLKR